MTAAATATSRPSRRLPPVMALGIATMVLVVTGGIYLAAHLSRRPPLGLPVVLLVAAAALLLWNVASLSRVRAFAWDKFFLVAGWALAAYVVIAGMLEYVFVLDHTRGGVLVVLTLTLAIFAVDVPMMLGFSVARFQPPGSG